MGMAQRTHRRVCAAEWCPPRLCRASAHTRRHGMHHGVPDVGVTAAQPRVVVLILGAFGNSCGTTIAA